MASDGEAEYLQEIVRTQLDGNRENRCIEIQIKDENGKICSRLVDASAVDVDADGETAVVHADQLVGLDLMNFRVISCSEEDVVQEIITESGDDEGDGHRAQYAVLQHSESDRDKGIAVAEYASEDNAGTQYMHIVEKDSVPLVFFSNKPIAAEVQKTEPKKLPVKRKKGDLILTEELLEHPKFKLFLYNCKQCDFKCNAIKELTAHRLKEHTNNGVTAKFRNSNMPVASQRESSNADILFGMNMSYCSTCSYSSVSPAQVRRHILKIHGKKIVSETSDYTTGGPTKEAKVTRKPYDYLQPSNSSVIVYYCEECGMAVNTNEDHGKHECTEKGSTSQSSH